jgi:hypothetical protein
MMRKILVLNALSVQVEQKYKQNRELFDRMTFNDLRIRNFLI